MTEYLQYSENTVHGFLIDGQGRISVMTEETYADGRLVQYLYVLCDLSANSLQASEFHCEEYEYDEVGLCVCRMQTLVPPLQNPPGFWKEITFHFMQKPVYRSHVYRFERRDGLLAGYRNEKGQYFPGPHIRRKA